MITDEDIKKAEHIRLEMSQYLEMVLPPTANQQERDASTLNFIFLKLARIQLSMEKFQKEINQHYKRRTHR